MLKIDEVQKNEGKFLMYLVSNLNVSYYLTRKKSFGISKRLIFALFYGLKN